jgi:uncharacterized protein with beta-barrel porin domain
LGSGISTLSAETTTGAEQTAFQLMDNFLGAMLDPFFDGRGNPNTSNSNALGYASANYSAPPKFDDAYAALKAPKPDAPAPQPWAVWGAAYGGSLSLNASDPASGAHDVSGSTYGFATGADYRATPNTTLGFAVAGGGTNWSLTDALGGGNSTAAQVGVYARTQSGPAYLAGALAYGARLADNSALVSAGSELHITRSLSLISKFDGDLRRRSRSSRAAPSCAMAGKGSETMVPGITGHTSLG